MLQAMQETIGLSHSLTRSFIKQLGAIRGELETAASAYPHLATTVRALRRLEKRLLRPVRLAVMGEFNAGKSSLANLLIGEATLPTLAISNTRIPTLICYSPRPEIAAVLSDGKKRPISAEKIGSLPEMLRIDIGLPSRRLAELEIIDLPGLSDPWLQGAGDELKRHAADAAIWCTFSTQAWRQSEHRAWLSLPLRLRQRGLLAVTNKDLIKNAADETRLKARLKREAGRNFRDIVLISSLQASAARGQGHNEELWQASGAGDLEAALANLVSDIRAHRIKVARRLIERIAGKSLSRLTGGR